MIDLHRHDEFSTFDGFGKATELVEIAKNLGHKALCISNHGNTNGWVATHRACKAADIKSILGVEGYFLPKYKEQERGFHLCLFAQNLKGYGNINRIQYEGEKQKYYNSIWDFDILEEYSEGVICTSACVAGFLAQCILKDNFEMAEKFIKKMVKIFADNFYIEIQPYSLTDEGMQEKVNFYSYKLAQKLGVKCILTSDSHYGDKADLVTYMKMHEIAKHDRIDIAKTYGERYMPSEKEIIDRFLEMHGKNAEYKEYRIKGSSDVSKGCYHFAKEMISNLNEIEEKCELNYLDQLEMKLPKVEGVNDSYKLMIEKTKEGLKERGKNTKEYIERCKSELEVIKAHGFADYFLIVADYVQYAKENDIVVGPGRGSVCNSLVAYAMGITDVDSLLFNLDFRRFLRVDKKKIPDIDLDFQTSRRAEIIDYLCEKYKGRSARICSYGLYKIDNLINDLIKVCNPEEISDNELNNDIRALKSLARESINEEDEIDFDKIEFSQQAIAFNEKYDNILKHFCKLFNKVRFIGTHSAGVAITGGEILDYVALRVDSKTGVFYTNYDLADVEDLNVIKFDILGLKTMESISELRETTGVQADYDEIINDEALLEQFRLQKCDGIFQCEKPTARKILKEIDTDCFEDVIATSCMNRPGPLSLKMHSSYAENKKNNKANENNMYYQYTKETYGTIVYQEQLQLMCVEIGGLSWGESDKVMKLMKDRVATMGSKMELEREKVELTEKFVKGAAKKGYSKEEARKVFESMLVYTFNKGHGTAYALISIEEMFYKYYYTNEYWFAKLKYAKDDIEFSKFCEKAVADDLLIFIPHVNISKASTALRDESGEQIIQLGLNTIKGVGDKAAAIIEREREKGIFKSYDDFYDRCKDRAVTKKVIELLKETGALEFKKKIYLDRVTKYNSALYQRSMR